MAESKEKCTFIICNNNHKKYILRTLSDKHLLYNLKFFTFRDLKKKLFFDYDNEALEYIIKNYHVNLGIAEAYLENMYFIEKGNSPKIQFLKKLKKELEDNNLLIIDKEFRNYFLKHKIIVYGFTKLTKEQELILNDISFLFKNKEVSDEFTPEVYEARDMEAEVEFIANDISQKIEQGVSLDNIKIIASEEYFKVMQRIFGFFRLPIKLESNNIWYATEIASEFLANYDNISLEDNINLLKEKNGINEFLEIINSSVKVKDKMIRKNFIINDLKKAKIKNKVYDKSIKLGKIDDIFNGKDYVYVVGFRLNSYPKIYKDDDFLSDKDKEILGIDTSTDKNRMAKEELKNVLLSIPNLIITYPKNAASGKCYSSPLIEELKLPVKACVLDESITYSKINSMFHYAKSLDNFIKFHDVNENLSLYKNNLDIPYRTYNHEFKGINENILKEHLNHELNLSYTSLEKYHECAFKYYLSYVLKLEDFEESFKIMVGSITHHILELGLKKEINIPAEIMEFIQNKEYKLSSKEFFYLEKLKDELDFILRVLKEQRENSALKKDLFETSLYVYNDTDDMKITVKGTLDKVMYDEIDGNLVLAVVDYKTGSFDISLDYLETGLNMQLPIYLYLLKKSDRFVNADIAGFYIQKVMSSIPNIKLDKTLEEIKKENLRLQGFSTNKESILKLIDKDYEDSKIIKGIKLKKDGEFPKNANVLSPEEMDEIIVNVEDILRGSSKKIINGEFTINPKVVKNKNIACEYCKFKDICFHTKDDEVIVGGEDNELDGRTEVSN